MVHPEHQLGEMEIVQESRKATSGCAHGAVN